MIIVGSALFFVFDEGATDFYHWRIVRILVSFMGCGFPVRPWPVPVGRAGPVVLRSVDQIVFWQAWFALVAVHPIVISGLSRFQQDLCSGYLFFRFSRLSRKSGS